MEAEANAAANRALRNGQAQQQELVQRMQVWYCSWTMFYFLLLPLPCPLEQVSQSAMGHPYSEWEFCPCFN